MGNDALVARGDHQAFRGGQKGWLGALRYLVVLLVGGVIGAALSSTIGSSDVRYLELEGRVTGVHRSGEKVLFNLKSDEGERSFVSHFEAANVADVAEGDTITVGYVTGVPHGSSAILIAVDPRSGVFRRGDA